MIAWLKKQWRAKQRRTDLEILWPACRDEARSIDIAQTVFYEHVSNDPAWTQDYSEADLLYFVAGLK